MSKLRLDVEGRVRVLVLAAVALVVVVAVVGWSTRGAASNRVRSAVQSLFVDSATSARTAHVDNCQQIGAETGARIYLCDVTAKNCRRYFQFAVFRESVYGAVPVSAPSYALQHPCVPLHS
jgi:hypothetical protein